MNKELQEWLKLWKQAHELIDKISEQSFRRLEATMKAQITRRLKELRLDSRGRVLNIPENNMVRLNMQMDFNRYVNNWIEREMGIAIDNTELLTEKPAPIKRVAESAAALAKIKYRQLEVDSKLHIIERLAEAAQNVRTESAKQTQDLFMTVKRAILRQDQYEVIKKSLDALGYNQAHGIAVTRGVFSEVYQDHQNEIAQKLNTNLWQLVGPFPIYGEKGHSVCQQYYLDIATTEEWEQRADAAVEPEVNAQSIWIYGNFGYNCRHQLMAIAQNDAIEAKKMLDNFKKNSKLYIEGMEAMGMDNTVKGTDKTAKEVWS